MTTCIVGIPAPPVAQLTVGSIRNCDSHLSSSSSSGPINWHLWSGIDHTHVAGITNLDEYSSDSNQDAAPPTTNEPFLSDEDLLQALAGGSDETEEVEPVEDTLAASDEPLGIHDFLSSDETSSLSSEHSQPPSISLSSSSPAASRISGFKFQSASSVLYSWASDAFIPYASASNVSAMGLSIIVIAVVIAALAAKVSRAVTSNHADLVVLGTSVPLYPGDQAPYLSCTPEQVNNS